MGPRAQDSCNTKSLITFVTENGNGSKMSLSYSYANESKGEQVKMRGRLDRRWMPKGEENQTAKPGSHAHVATLDDPRTRDIEALTELPLNKLQPLRTSACRGCGIGVY